ncbi:DinB family protein [Pedobacter sp. L105]|uniref:DinB family protein n=1 Tax=Pedobacter sp. L105 TaxID=1641871 RepID=UPI00131CB0BD|nr:DinB family protein [Pedobacter sp. L105]
MNQPQPNEYSGHVSNYISLVSGDIIELLQRQATEFPEFLSEISGKADYAYEPGKWTIKEMTGHIIDTERIFAYRLTAIARGEQQLLPGFDQDGYMANTNFSDRSLLSLSEEFGLLRKANLYLFRSFTEEELDRIGTASDRKISVRAILYATAGHLIHHIQVIKDKYL